MTSLEKVNVKRLIDHSTKEISSYLESFLFEPKSEMVKNRIKYGISSLLKGKFQEYTVDVTGESSRELDWIEKVLGRDHSIDSLLNVDITIIPIKTVDRFHINFKVE